MVYKVYLEKELKEGEFFGKTFLKVIVEANTVKEAIMTVDKYYPDYIAASIFDMAEIDAIIR
jgi:hypothetical protein